LTRMQPVKPTLLQIHHLDSCESSNECLLSAAEAGAPAGTVMVAHAQTAGRGRRGRAWIGEPGKTLTFSVLWTFPVTPVVLNGLSLAMGVALARALHLPHLGTRKAGARFGLKWPNDVLLRVADQTDAKVGGILIESTIRKAPDGSRELAAVIGIGLNCLSSGALKAMVSEQNVAAVSDGFHDAEGLTPEVLLPTVLEYVQETLVAFSETGFESLREAWQAANLWQGDLVCVKEIDQVLLEGTIQGIDKDGALLLATPSGVERIVTGDVSLRKV